MSRLWGLDRHFAHIDDIGLLKTIFDARIFGKPAVFAVPSVWTFAPLQFIFTSFLVSFDQHYREMLFWGRLPSFLISVAGLLTAFWFYFRLKMKRTGELFVGLSLLACSWQAIIFTKQMNNYAFGLTCSWLILLLLTLNFSQKRMTLFSVCLQSFVLAAVCYAHYQLLLLVPAYFLAIFFYWRSSESISRITVRLLAGMVVFFVVFFPLYHFFFSKVYDPNGIYNGLNYNTGPHGEFLYAPDSALSLFQKMYYTLDFFVRNLFVTIHAMLAFLPDRNNALTSIFRGLFTLFFLTGILAFTVDKKGREDRLIACYILFAFAFWVLFILTDKLTFSPTRHSMIYIPLLIICVTKGIRWYAAVIIGYLPLNNRDEVIKNTLLILSMTVLFFFSANFHFFVQERSDPFNEYKIFEVLKKYDTDLIFSFDSTVQITLMKSLRDYFGSYDTGHVPHDVLYKQGSDFSRIAWISHRSPLNEGSWAELYKTYNTYVRKRTPYWQAEGKQPPPLVPRDLDKYRIIYSEEYPSDIQVDYSRLTLNGSNGFYFYVLERNIDG